jgi:hypothetical protein
MNILIVIPSRQAKQSGQCVKNSPMPVEVHDKYSKFPA